MVGEVLQKQRSGESVPPDVMDFILQSMPDEIQEDSIHDVFLIDSCFPDPFSKAHNVLLELVEHLLPTEPKAFRVLEKPRNLFPGATWAWDDPNYVEQAKKKGVEKITVLIDRTCSKPQLKKEMCAWVDTTDVSAIQKRRVLKGKAASPPWHRLRELAAYRLPIGCLTTRE